MNALVGIRLGMQEPTRAHRVETARKVASEFGGVQQQARAVIEKSLETAKAAGNQTTGNSTVSTARRMETELGKEAFLQLLVFQMQNQDPLDPTDNAEMLSQLAQFSALEQMNNLNDRFAALSGAVEQTNFLAANSLIGRTVSGTDVNGNAQEGKVTRVLMTSGSGLYVMVNDAAISVSSIQRVE